MTGRLRAGSALQWAAHRARSTRGRLSNVASGGEARVPGLGKGARAGYSLNAVWPDPADAGEQADAAVSAELGVVDDH